VRRRPEEDAHMSVLEQIVERDFFPNTKKMTVLLAAFCQSDPAQS
jgi:hypothetical protein